MLEEAPRDQSVWMRRLRRGPYRASLGYGVLGIGIHIRGILPTRQGPNQPLLLDFGRHVAAYLRAPAPGGGRLIGFTHRAANEALVKLCPAVLSGAGAILRGVVDRLRSLGPHIRKTLVCTMQGEAYTESGCRSNWHRLMKTALKGRKKNNDNLEMAPDSPD